jgi:hypothetical protein
MSGVSLNVKVTGDADLQGLLARVTGPGALRSLHAAMGVQVKEKIFTHLVGEAASRHTTASRLGATPSGHLEQMARAVETTLVSADDQAATLTINHPGIGRALHDVTIVPVNAKALAIPVNALAYNRRPGQFARDAMFVWQSKTTGNAFLAMRQPEKTMMPVLMYLLVRSVTQKQDRTLLPSAAELSDAGAKGALNWFHRQMNEASR